MPTEFKKYPIGRLLLYRVFFISLGFLFFRSSYIGSARLCYIFKNAESSTNSDIKLAYATVEGNYQAF